VGIESVPNIVTVGTLIPRKNSLSLIQAASQIAAEWPYTNFILVGPITDAEYYERITESASSQGLSKQVFFTGLIKEHSVLPSYYCLADVFVVTTTEGFSNALLEAMSCGRAIVASDIPENREVAIYGDEMVFVDVNDIDELSSAVNALLRDPDRRKRLGECARRTALEFYDSAVAERILMFFRNIQEKQNAKGLH
jgi:glycosyltransferase involved in cell wall biosynthesis